MRGRDQRMAKGDMMDDRFLCRVYDNEDKRMYYPREFTLSFHGNTWRVTTQYNDVGVITPGRGVLMQCTGLKDKSGKLIYEGDVLQVGIFGRGVVRFGMEDIGANNDEYSSIIYGHWVDPIVDDDGYNSETMTRFMLEQNYCEVIGNIHEIPELTPQL